MGISYWYKWTMLAITAWLFTFAGAEALGQVSVASSSLSHTSISSGQVLSMSATLASSQSLSNLIIDFRIVNSSGQMVHRKQLGGSISAGGTLPLKYDYLIPSLPLGTYKFDLGVWNQSWATLYYGTRASFSIVSATTSTTVPSTSTTTTTTTCNYPNWVQGQYYAAGAIVKYSNGLFYKAKYANPGYNPTISTYYWAQYSCTSSTTNTTQAPSTSITNTTLPLSTSTCNYPNWVQGQYYAAGAIVKYSNGSFYKAKYANPGYNPTISTYYWALYNCTSSTTTSPTTNTTIAYTGGSSSASTANPIPPLSIQMTCVDTQIRYQGSYAVENNMWGASGVSPAQQCAGIGGIAPDGSVSARWTWNYGTGPNEVKGYPGIVYGQKPGYRALSGSTLPKRVNDITVATTAWNTTGGGSGKGHNAYDIWLTRDPNYYGGFLNTPITHEIMISTNNWGTYGDYPNPAWVFENEVTIAGMRFRVTKADNFGIGNKWRFIVFKMLDDRPIGNLDLMPFIQYMKSRGLITGNEYMSSIEYGTEPEHGSGEIQVHGYKVNVR